MRRLRIVHTEASGGWGGQEIRILSEARGMISRGHEVMLVCPADASICVAAPRYGVPVVSLPIGKKRFPAFVALRRWLAQRRRQIDIVNTHSSTDSWLAALACTTMKDAPPIIRTRHLSTPVNSSGATRWLYQKGCRHLVVTGEAIRQQLVRDNGYDPQSITSVPTGIDLSRFQPRDRIEARRRLGLSQQAVYIGILATLRDWKGHTVLFDALSRLKTSHPRVRVLVIGDGPYRDRLDARLSAIDLADRVDFVGHREDAEQWLNSLDVFALPSWGDEGVSQALMQAMASELPVVATPVGSLGEIVIDGETGILVPPRDPDALAAALARLLDDRDYAGQLAAAARRLALERCGMEAMLDRMEALFLSFARPEPA